MCDGSASAENSGGGNVLIRITSIVTLSMSLAACAQSPMLDASYLGVGGLNSAPEVQSVGSIITESEDLDNSTLAGKVLTAIALERITGLKPDPARFSELD